MGVPPNLADVTGVYPVHRGQLWWTQNFTDLRSACQGLKRMVARRILPTRLRPFLGLQSLEGL